MRGEPESGRKVNRLTVWSAESSPGSESGPESQLHGGRGGPNQPPSAHRHSTYRAPGVHTLAWVRELPARTGAAGLGGAWRVGWF